VVQPIETAKGEKLNFVKMYIAGRDPKKPQDEQVSGGLGILTSGAWCYFPSGQPIPQKEVGVALLRAVRNQQALDAFEAWWQRQEELAELAEGPQPRAIHITQDARLVYADDGTEVESREDIFAFFPPKKGGLLNYVLGLFQEAEAERQAHRERALVGLPEDRLTPEGKQRQQAGAAHGRAVIAANHAAGRKDGTSLSVEDVDHPPSIGQTMKLRANPWDGLSDADKQRRLDALARGRETRDANIAQRKAQVAPEE